MIKRRPSVAVVCRIVACVLLCASLSGCLLAMPFKALNLINPLRYIDFGSKARQSGGVPGSKSYVINGRRYYPMKSAKGFVQEGIASWYGRDFHGKLTANGERYDMYGMTAAHKTLPLGTIIRVTHLGNGRAVTLRVNDRGPFVGERIVDLTYTAAQKLGIVREGTGRVRIQPIGSFEGDSRR